MVFNVIKTLRHCRFELYLKRIRREQSIVKLSITTNPILKLSDMATSSNIESNDDKCCKPPNILLLCPDNDFDEMKSALQLTLNCQKYTIHHMTENLIKSTPWSANAKLLIIAKDLASQSDEDKTEIIDIISTYFFEGGNLLSAGSDFINCFLQTVKRRSKTFVDASDADTILTDFNSVGCPVIALGKNGDQYREILAYFRTLENPPVDAISYYKLGSPGLAILSDLHLLQRSDTSWMPYRHKLLDNVLTEMFNLDCSIFDMPSLTPCYLYASTEVTESFLKSYRQRATSDGKLRSSSCTLSLIEGVREGQGDPLTSETFLPLIAKGDNWILPLHAFDSKCYFDRLRTRTLGRAVMFTEVIPTTMTVIEGLVDLPDIVAIAKIQTKGRGRGNNAWLSPEGCAMFTYPLCFSLQSKLGQRPSFLQHMASLAIVEGLNEFPNVEEVGLRLKWPNDILIGSSKIKIGGILVKSNVLGSAIQSVIGCGVNVSNASPTACVNQFLKEKGFPPLQVEEVIASTFNHMEELYMEFQTNGPAELVKRYLAVWLHSDAEVTLPDGQQGRVVGLDHFGFLRVKVEDSRGISFVSLQPDGNSFDMMRNMIIAK